MPALPVLPVDHPMLRRKSSRIRSVTPGIRKMIDDMFATMDQHRGVGVAANQIGRPWRLVVVGVDDDRLALVNPEIVRSSGSEVADEGCLSLPNWFGPVERAQEIVVRALDPTGKRIRRDATGLLARAIQHEIDHLDGVIFTDRLTEPDALRFVDPNSPEAQRLRAS